jgi:phosphoserine phosphatase
MQSLGLLRRNLFLIKIRGYDSEQHLVLEKEVETDVFGQIYEKISLPQVQIHVIKFYECSCEPGLESHLGTYLPAILTNPKKLIISDFDKTLVDTRYSTTKELYTSLTSPIQTFPTIDKSLTLYRDHLKEGFTPFILTASPHFYENAIRDWLYQQEIYGAMIFLKDYRNVFSIFHGSLRPKDLKAQGYYKLSQLLKILWLTGIPDQLVLMGDGFEADPMIYLTLRSILLNLKNPRSVWSEVRQDSHFNFSSRQNGEILQLIYTLQNLQLKKQKIPDVAIYIRQKNLSSPINLPLEFLSNQKEKINFYEA